MADTCADQYCTEDPKYSVLYVAPCGTISRDEVGKPPAFTPAELDLMSRFAWCGAFERTPDTTRTERVKGSSCGANSCFYTIKGADVSFEVEICKDDMTIRNMAHPNKSCTLDYAFFPWPEDCANPDPAKDEVWVGSIQIPPVTFSFDPDSDDPITVQIEGRECNNPFCIFNDPTEDVAVPLITGKEKAAALNTGK